MIQLKAAMLCERKERTGKKTLDEKSLKHSNVTGLLMTGSGISPEPQIDTAVLPACCSVEGMGKALRHFSEALPSKTASMKRKMSYNVILYLACPP